MGNLNGNFDGEFNGNLERKLNGKIKNFDWKGRIWRRGGVKRNGEKGHKKGIIIFLFTLAMLGYHS